MALTSLRYRLPLTYALIALLSAVALGVGQVALLRGYYQQEEARYLRASAEIIGRALAPHLALQAPAGALQSQLAGISFLAQARVRLLDASGALLADSGTAEVRGPVTVSIQVAVGQVTQAFSQTVTGAPEVAGYRSVIMVAGEGLALEDETAFQAGDLVSQMPVVRTPFGVVLGAASPSAAVSDQSLRWPVTREAGGAVLGYVELSEGPAYGRAVIERVAAVWAVAGLAAVLLAAAAGWRISRGLTQPLEALSAAAASMAGGNLAARAPDQRRDELGALARAFNAMAQRLEALVATLRQFVTDAAHALNTPLTVLHSDLDLIAASLIDPEQAARVQRARGQVARLAALAGQLLDLSRVEMGGSERARVDLRDLVRAACEPYASWAEQKGVRLSLALAPGPLPIQADASQLSQVAANVLDNAVKFTPPGGRIDVKLATTADQALLRVCNTGPGLEPDEVPLVFDRFRRGHNAAGVPGSGLGLALVHAIVQAHGGRVALQSSAADTCVEVSLPLTP